MTFINDKIGEWTPAQLQSFIQDIVSVQGSQIPPSLNFTQSDISKSRIENLDIATSLNFGSKVGVSQGGAPIQQGLVPVADENGQLQWKTPHEWERPHAILGDTWAGQNWDSATFTTTNSPLLTNQRRTLQLIELKRRTTTHGFYVHVAQAATGTTWVQNGFGLYGPVNPGDTQVALLHSLDNGSTGNLFESTGLKNIEFTGPISHIDPGFYYFGVLVNWSAVGTRPALLGTTAGGINAANAGGLSRSCGNTSATGTMGSASFVGTGQADFATFTNVFWVGALAAD